MNPTFTIFSSTESAIQALILSASMLVLWLSIKLYIRYKSWKYLKEKGPLTKLYIQRMVRKLKDEEEVHDLIKIEMEKDKKTKRYHAVEAVYKTVMEDSIPKAVDTTETKEALSIFQSAREKNITLEEIPEDHMHTIDSGSKVKSKKHNERSQDDPILLTFDTKRDRKN